MQESLKAMKANKHRGKQPNLRLFSAEWRISGCIMINVENGQFEEKIMMPDLQRQWSMWWRKGVGLVYII
jgi:hypothetical protein